MDHLLIVAARLTTDDRPKVDSPRNEEVNAGVRRNADARKLDHLLLLDHRRELNARSVAAASGRNHRQHKANVWRGRHNSGRKPNA
jgi:hypothetical protein